MNREEAIKVLRTESVELGGSVPSVCRFWEALDMAIAALRQQEAVTDRHQMTNADRIRAMSDEELAEIIMCPYNIDEELCSKAGICLDCCLKWLQQPCGGCE